MIHVDKNTYIPSVEETLGTLRMHTSMMPQFVDFDKVMMNINYLQFEIENVSKPLFEVIGRPVGVNAADNMKAWLIKHEDVSGFNMAKTGLSLDKKSIDAALESETLTEFGQSLIKVYQSYSNYVKTRGTLISLLQNPISNVPSCDGHRMLIIRPDFEPQNTGRIGMRNPAVQNFPHAIQEITTVPEGYVLLHTDSGQIEPRIVYSVYIKDPQIQALIRLYNDAYFGILHYITMPEELILSGTTNFQKNEITEEMQAGRKGIKTYSNAVMYGSTSNPSGDPIKAKMIERIGKHPSRRALVESLMRQINAGVRTVYTAFGTPIDMNKSPKLSGDSLRAETVEDELLKLAINNPIQGTAADLMRVSVYEANRILMNEGKKSYIIDYVHDAGRFAIHEDDYGKVADKLGDIVHYEVDGWLPIYAEPEFGRDGGSRGLIKDLY